MCVCVGGGLKVVHPRNTPFSFDLSALSACEFCKWLKIEFLFHQSPLKQLVIDGDHFVKVGNKKILQKEIKSHWLVFS